jgi:DNA-binding transcriptional regulator GbsR (MarR family)
MEVGEMVKALDRSQPAVSRILRTLRDLNVVRYQKARKLTLYKVKHANELQSLLDCGEAYIRNSEVDLERAS